MNARYTAAFATLAMVLLTTVAAFGHPTGTGKTFVLVKPDTQEVDFLVSVNIRDIGDFLRLDADNDDKVSLDELEASAATVEDYLQAKTSVTTGAKPCKTSRARFVGMGKPGEIAYAQTFVCDAPLTEVELANRVLLDDRGGHRHIAKIQLGEEVMTTTFSRDFPTYTVTVPSLITDEPVPTVRRAMVDTLLSYGWSGVTHILGGFDHVLFVLALLVVAANARALAGIISAFTLGHSVTLGLAAVGLVSAPGWLVEPLIALTIMVVGVENVVRFKEGEERRGWGRYLMAGIFGLIHGFGFANVLRDDVGLPDEALIPALLSFNVGVELGQIAIAAIAWPLLRLSFKRVPKSERTIVTAVSLAVTVAAGYWFVERTLLT